MNMNDRLRAGFVGLMLAACSNLGRPAVTPEPPAVTGVSSSGLELGVELRVDNPNPFPLVANGIRGTLFLEDNQKLGAATAHLDQAIAAKGTGTVQSQLDIPWTSIGTLREFVGKAEVPFTFKGELGVSGGPMKLSVPFELRGHLTREQIVAVSGSLLAPLLER
jgi:LEA14-like dessication related protein